MNFDRLAPHYDWMELMLAGGLLQRVRTAGLEALQGRRKILSAGEGHGRFAAACAARFPAAELTCVEASAGMLARARRRAGSAADRVRWHRAVLPEGQPAGRYDAIVTCFFLDCFPPAQLEAVIDGLAAAAADDAVWLVADFAVPAGGPGRWRARAVHFLMYAFFRRAVALPALRLTPPDDRLHAHGFRRIARREFSWGLLHADVWQRAPR
jgi:ubiquinone/menaquinone biosynthesis C-methylase UbiE